MQDNGLLKFYEECRAKGGELDLSKLPFKGQSWQCYNFNEVEGVGSFYIKTCSASKLESEILVGQIYAQLGLTAAIYLPAISRECRDPFVISNDIGGENITRMHEFLNTVKQQVPYICGKNANDDISSFFTSKAIEVLALQEAANVACNNTDAHSGNRLVRVTKTQPFRKGFVKITPVKAEDVGILDYGLCFAEDYSGKPLRTVSYTLFNEQGVGQRFYNKSDFKIINNLKDNPVVQQHINCSEIAEMIGNCDVYQTAKDVTETIGYEFTPRFLDKFANSVEFTAELLAR